jgi:hypothetical protein
MKYVYGIATSSPPASSTQILKAVSDCGDNGRIVLQSGNFNITR